VDTLRDYSEKLLRLPNRFFFEEVIYWIKMDRNREDYCSSFQKQLDYIFYHKELPLKLKEWRGDEYTNDIWNSLSMEDLLIDSLSKINRPSNFHSVHQVFLISILNRIYNFSDEFISYYEEWDDIYNTDPWKKWDDQRYTGKGKYYDKIIGSLEGNLFIDFMFIPKLYNFDIYSFMTADISNLVENKTNDGKTNEFGFSMETTRNFLNQLIIILKLNRRTFLKNDEKLTPNSQDSGEEDKRINTKVKKVIIRNYFLKLNQSNESGEEIMSIEDIKKFLQANFICFGKKQIIEKFTPKLNQANLKYFMYLFYLNHSKKVDERIVLAKDYANLLIKNFTQFENIGLKTITDNFKKKPKYYPENLM
jgi:hypothetical protein